MIEVHNLRKSYGSLVAVDGVSFTIPRGETFGLLGPNGAGKSTTILMLAGALRPDAGTVSINGAADPTVPGVRRQLGLAPQKIALYEELSAEENLTFYGKLYGLHGTALRQRVEWCLDFAGLADRRRDRTGTYSGGMQRRINMACSLVHDPAVVFLDEPTAGVDPQSRSHIFDSIEKLAAEGRTLLYTTHYMEEAERLCDRVAIMDHGKVLALDTVEELLKRHGRAGVVEAELEEAPADPSRLPGRLDGTTLRIETAEPMEAVARLASSGVKLRALRIDRPDLESVFLALTGRRLRD